MKWYGCTYFKKNDYIRNIKIRNNLRMKSLSIVNLPSINLNKRQILLYLPIQWKFILINYTFYEKSHILCYMYSSAYYYHLPFNRAYAHIFYDKQTHVVSFISLYTTNFFNVYWTFFKLIFNTFSAMLFNKLKFKGKGYYMYKSKRNTIALQFGYAHIVRIYTFLVNLKFLSKTAVLLVGLNKNDLLSISHNFRLRRPHNIFTGKGVRFTRQIIYKKTGKISSYR